MDASQVVRSRLASRTSFFGGPVSTRNQCTAPSWRELSLNQKTPPPPLGDRSKNHKELPKHMLRSHNDSLSKSSLPSMKRKRRPQLSKAEAVLRAAVHKICRKRKRDNADVLGAAPTSARQPLSLSSSHRSLQQHPKAIMRKYRLSSCIGPQTLQVVHPLISSSTPPAPSTASQHAMKDTKCTITASLGRAAGTTPENLGKFAEAEHNEKKTGTRRRVQASFYGNHQPPAALCPMPTRIEEESASDLDSFIDDERYDESDDGCDVGGEHHCDEGRLMFCDGESIQRSPMGPKGKVSKPTDWRTALRDALGGYDGKNFAEVDAQPDRRMHASFEEIAMEEAHALRIARAVDRREAAREEAARKARAARKLQGHRRGCPGVDSSSESDSESDEEDEFDDSKSHGAAMLVDI